MENPKARNKKESKPKSNLNLSQKKKLSIKSNISYPNLEKGEKRTGTNSDDLMVANI